MNIWDYISVSYIIILICGTEAMEWFIRRYFPAIVPDNIEKAISSINNPVMILFRQDWTKLITIILGIVIGNVFNDFKIEKPLILVTSYMLVVVFYSYVMKYGKAYFDQLIDKLKNGNV